MVQLLDPEGRLTTGPDADRYGHLIAALDDATLAGITDELIERDWAPKVYGAWYLNEAEGSRAS